MRAAVALVIAVVVIFGAAMVAEYAGVVQREAPPVQASAHGDGPAGSAGDDAIFSSVSEAQLRNGVMGGFVLVCLYVILRHRGAI